MKISSNFVDLLDRHVADLVKCGQFAKQAPQGSPFAGLQAIEKLLVVLETICQAGLFAKRR